MRMISAYSIFASGGRTTARGSLPSSTRHTVYGLNGRSANFVIDLSLGAYEHAI